MSQGDWGEEKRALGGRWDGEREEERPLADNVWFFGRICRSLVVAEPSDDLDDFLW